MESRSESVHSLHLEDLEPKAVTVSSSKSSVRNMVGSVEDRVASATEVGGFLINSNPEFTSIAIPGEVVSQRSLAMDSFTTAASTLSLEDFCKICHCGHEQNMPLIAPCVCSGSLKYVHQECLQRWIKSSDIKRCELCKYPFSMQSKVKPFCQWEKLDMTSIERRKLFCSVTFHIIAITCVVWSLYVLIDRTATEIKNGQLQWPFWTKLIVVAIGFTGGLVFMYIQCKVYVHLCRKWKAYNRIIVVQEAPEGAHKTMTCGTESLGSAKQDYNSSSNNAVSTGSIHNNMNEVARETSSSTSRGVATAIPTGPPPSSSRRPSAPEQPLNTSSSSSTSGDTKKTNAETQTALRGMSIKEVINRASQDGDGGIGQSKEVVGQRSESAVVTVSKILKDMSHKEKKGAIFFTECDGDSTDEASIQNLGPQLESDKKKVALDESGDFSNLVRTSRSHPDLSLQFDVVNSSCTMNVEPKQPRLTQNPSPKSDTACQESEKILKNDLPTK